MSKTNESSQPRPEPNFAYLDELHLVGIEHDLAAGKYVEPERLVSLLCKHGQRPTPPAVLEYMCEMLEGKVARPKWRRPLSEVIKRQVRMIIRGLYQEYLRRLQARKRKHGHPAGWTSLSAAG